MHSDPSIGLRELDGVRYFVKQYTIAYNSKTRQANKYNKMSSQNIQETNIQYNQTLKTKTKKSHQNHSSPSRSPNR
jgi:hypothetical protein